MTAADRGRAHLTGQKPDGSFKWCIYPCQQKDADGKTCRVSVSAGYNGRVWSVTGPADAPTISPSIDCQGGCGWHGFINAGVLS